MGQSTPPRHLPPSTPNPARLSQTGRTRVRQQGQARLRRRLRHPIEAHSQRNNHPTDGIENAPSLPRGPSPGKPCAHDGRAQQAPARSDLQVGVCCVIHQYVRLLWGPCSSEKVEYSYSDWARPSMTNRWPWSSLVEEGASRLPRRHTLKSTEDPRLMLLQSPLDHSDHQTRVRRRCAKGWTIHNRRIG